MCVRVRRRFPDSKHELLHGEGSAPDYRQMTVTSGLYMGEGVANLPLGLHVKSANGSVDRALVQLSSNSVMLYLLATIPAGRKTLILAFNKSVSTVSIDSMPKKGLIAF